MNRTRQRLRSDAMDLLKRGNSQRAVARMLGITPRTVARMVKEQEERTTLGESAVHSQSRIPDRGNGTGPAGPVRLVTV